MSSSLLGPLARSPGVKATRRRRIVGLSRDGEFFLRPQVYGERHVHVAGDYPLRKQRRPLTALGNPGGGGPPPSSARIASAGRRGGTTRRSRDGDDADPGEVCAEGAVPRLVQGLFAGPQWRFHEKGGRPHQPRARRVLLRMCDALLGSGDAAGARCRRRAGDRDRRTRASRSTRAYDSVFARSAGTLAKRELARQHAGERRGDPSVPCRSILWEIPRSDAGDRPPLSPASCTHDSEPVGEARGGR